MASSSSTSHKRRPTSATAAASHQLNITDSKSQKHFEQLRRLILGRNPQLEDIRALVTRDPSCVQQSDAHHGLLPLHWACVFQNPLDIVQYLHEAYPSALDQVDSDGRTPLHHACRPEGRVELVEYLLEQNRRVVTLRDHRGKTPLHCACTEFVPSEMVRLLLHANTSAVKIRTRDGHTPLHCACECNAPLATIKLLVDAYPEAVKYIRADPGSELTGKFAQAKEYLAWKVKQTEEEAEQLRQEAPGRASQSNMRRYEHDTSQHNVTSESDQVRRRLEEEERKIVREEKELHRIAQQKQDAALQRLQEQELDVELKAAELDRLIHQKEAHLESNRFQKELISKRQLNDSGIGRSRSFNDPPPAARPFPSNPKHDFQTMTPSVLSSRGVSADMEEDEQLFTSLRNSTQPLYPESKLSASNASWMAAAKGRDPSVADEEPEVVPMDETKPPKSEVSSNPLQEELQQALRLLEEAEQRRQKEIKEAQEQQTALQSELGKLMEKLEVTEQEKKLKPPPPPSSKKDPRPSEEQPHKRSSSQVVSVGTSASPTMESTNPPSSRRRQPGKDNLEDAKGQTPLHIACAHGASYTTVQFLLQQFPLAIYHVDQDGYTPLHHACACSETPLEVLQLLLDIFPAACWMESTSQTQLPLHLACQHHGQRVEVLQLLMETARGVEAAAQEAESSLP